MAKKKKIVHKKSKKRTLKKSDKKQPISQSTKFEKIKNQSEITFKAPEFQYWPKGPFWIITFFIIGIILSDIFYYERQYLAIGVVVLGAIVMLQKAFQRPEKVVCKLTTKGIEFNKRFFHYTNFKSFWLAITKTNIKLYFDQAKKFAPPLTIILDEVDPLEVRDFLKNYLPEQKTYGEDLADRLGRILRF